MPTLEAGEETLIRAAGIIRQGGLVAFPTETVYGLGGDAFNVNALAAIFAAKNRPRFDPLIVHIAAIAAMEEIAELSALDTRAQENLSKLTQKLWPGPLTLILPKRRSVPDLATSGLSTVAVRLPANKTARRLIELAGTAIAAPSANPFGYISPTTAKHVEETLGEKVDLIIDGGPAQVGLESTVLDVQARRILRPGGTPKEAIEEIIGEVCTGGFVTGKGENGVPVSGNASPGLLKTHYSPHSALSVHEGTSICGLPCGKDKTAFLFFDRASKEAWLAGHPREKHAHIAVLSEKGDTAEAAAVLFQTLHEMDSLGIKQIHAQLAPPHGLGQAINDRLQRAQSGKE